MDLNLRSTFQGLASPAIGLVHPKLKSYVHFPNWSRFEKFASTHVMPGKIRNEGIHCFRLRKYYLSVGRNYHLATSDDANVDQEPFWSFMLKKAIRLLKSLIIFLIEQPSQLKYIEWPSFQSTLKTATLTLLLVGMLIVALSSVDSALCYILALLSRRHV